MFKIGDKVRRINHDWLGIKVGDINVIDGVNDVGLLSFDKFPDSGFNPENFELVEEKMKAELTLETARKMYEEGGAGKAFALDNYSEEELNNKFPKTLEEAIARGYVTPTCSSPLPMKYNSLYKLEQLRNAYWKIDGDWKPDWKNIFNVKYVIVLIDNKIQKSIRNTFASILSFRTEDIRDEFYENFKDLIEEAKDLLGYIDA